MASNDGDEDTVLSDVEGEDPAPILLNAAPSSSSSSSSSSQDEVVSVERFREIRDELDREKKAREVAENSKSDLQTSFNRLKALAHEAIKKRDESTRLLNEAKEEVAKVKENYSFELDESNRIRYDLSKELDEVGKEKDALRTEVESSAHMLVTGIEKISAKVSNFKNFMSGGLPRSQKYTTGLPAVSYGVIKRTNEIVEELLNQVDAASKSRNEAREQVEQRNYEIAIEVSQLESTISGLREEVETKSKSLEEKDKKIAEVEKEVVELRELALESEDKFRNMESKIDVLRPLLLNQLNMVSKIHDRVHDIIKIVDDDKLSISDMSESLFLPQETDVEENMCASLAGMDYIYELVGILGGKTKNVVEENDQKLQNLNETVNRLMKEKEDIGSLLRSVLSKRTGSDTNQLFHVAENGLGKSGIDFHFSNVFRGGKHSGSVDKQRDMDTEEDEIFSLAGALENIVKASQLQIIELQHSVEELRAESKLLKEHVDIQAKDLNLRKKQIEELEEKERVANENVEGLMMDIAAAEEEITRWKEAAEQEAAAGKAIEQELLAQLSTIRQELEEAKESMLESEKKLKFKEETAVAAMAARDAAEKSLRLADSRSSRLRDKVEELTHQLEELDTREDSRMSRNNARYMCWPWEWLGLNYQGLRLTDTPIRTSNEMELSEPML